MAWWALQMQQANFQQPGQMELIAQGEVLEQQQQDEEEEEDDDDGEGYQADSEDNGDDEDYEDDFGYSSFLGHITYILLCIVFILIILLSCCN